MMSSREAHPKVLRRWKTALVRAVPLLVARLVPADLGGALRRTRSEPPTSEEIEAQRKVLTAVARKLNRHCADRATDADCADGCVVWAADLELENLEADLAVAIPARLRRSLHPLANAPLDD